MPRARKELVHIDTTPFYHCYVRCVRRAYLCGDDHKSGTNYDHRKAWLISRLKFLSFIFPMDICAYAVMSNHYHVVLHVDKQRAENWSNNDVVERWTQLFQPPLLIKRWLQEADDLSDVELETIDDIICQWRKRLLDIGWFMRCVNEKIARMANAEDNVTGRFWEGRFKSQALLDEAALLTCMAYVDLNPVRAAMANSLEKSDFTSIQERLYTFAKRRRHKTPENKRFIKRIDNQKAKIKKSAEIKDAEKPSNIAGLTNTATQNAKLPQATLMPFDGSSHTKIYNALPFTREDYFQLVESTGRIIRSDKRGAINATIQPIMSRYGIDPSQWLTHVKHFDRCFSYCAGSSDNLIDFAHLFDRKWVKGCGKSNVKL